MVGMIEVDRPEHWFFEFAGGGAVLNLDAVANQLVLGFVDLQEGLGGVDGDQGLDGIVVGAGGVAGVELFEGLAEVAGEDDFGVVGASEGAVGSEFLAVKGIDRLPAEGLGKVVGGGLLDELVFRVGSAHGVSGVEGRARLQIQ